MKKLVTLFSLLLLSAISVMGQSTPGGNRFPMWDWHGIGNGRLPKTVGYFFTEDTISMRVEEENLPADQMKVRLQAGQGITWRKELVFLNSCNGATQTIFTQDGRTSDEMTVTKSGCANDSITYRKMKLFGSMATLYHMDPVFFWKVWGGKTVTITWQADGWGAGNSGPFSCSYPCIPLGTNPLGGVVYDNDNLADIALWRPSGGAWLPFNSSNGARPSINFGSLGDTPIPMDYDRDGRTDAAVYRFSNNQGQFLILNSFTGTTRIENFGAVNDVPVPGDYDGDGKMDVAVWRPAGTSREKTKGWRMRFSSGGANGWVQIGAAGDIPVPGHYDGGVITNAAVFRPSTGTWFMDTGIEGAIETRQFGMNGDSPAPADFDGDGKTDLAVYRPTGNLGTWFIQFSSNGSGQTVQWGLATDRAVPADYDGDGKADIAIWRPSTGEWYILKSTDGGTQYEIHGNPTDLPVPRK